MIMSTQFTRRNLLRTAVASGAVAATASFPLLNSAFGTQPLSVVDWEAPWIDNAKKIAAAWGKSDINWTLHAGSAAAILPEIKAAWPNPPYDIVNNWSPAFLSMMRENWAETVTLDDCPNLADVPEDFITMDGGGNWKNIPRGIRGVFFTYAPDNCPIKINSIEDLLDPKLKGQIVWPNPTLNTNLQVVALATARGGNEYNLEPGWEFLAEIASSGNIGRISASPSDAISSLDSGETSIGFVDGDTVTNIKGAKLNHLTKTDTSFKTFLSVSGWAVLSSSENKKLAFDFANFTINRENSELFYREVGEIPVNKKAKHGADHLRFSAAEADDFVVIPDWDHLSVELDSSNERFEKNIVPLL